MVYLATLSSWIALTSLDTTARLLGWWWRPELGRPLTLVMFAPLRVFPAAWFPVLANIVTAFGAALLLQQLARSVAILRQDIPPDGSLRNNRSAALFTGPMAWLPPMLAVLVCGLHLGFWEHATAASGEIWSLLCFAIGFRCVLEFRLELQDRWLFRGALAFALGMTDNWLMIGYLPAFVAAVIWVKGYGQCLDVRFLLRMSGMAVAGLSLYLLMPTVLCATAPEPSSFLSALKSELAAQKHALQIFRLPALRLLLLTAVLPFVLLAVKWRSHTVQLADDTQQGVFVSKYSGHFVHATMFLAALWLSLNTTLVPRQIEQRTPLLLYHYTWALVVGHCVGYLLLFGRATNGRRPAKWPAATAVVLLVLMPAVLLWKNFADLRLTNSGALRDFAGQICDDLPPGRVTALSDETLPLLLVHAELAARGRANEVMLIDTRSLAWPEYHRYLRRNYPTRWPAPNEVEQGEFIRPARLLANLKQIATSESVVYLQPSSGFFFEDFTATPRGWVQQLTLRPASVSQDLAANEFRWQTRWTNQLARWVRRVEENRARTARWSAPPLSSYKLSSPPNATAVLLAVAYSKVLDQWGVLAQRAGWQSESELWLERALKFDPDNLAARINLEFIARHRRGDPTRLSLAWLRETYPLLLARYDRWADVISRSGPVDEPTFLFHTGGMYLAAGNPQQAVEAFARSAALAPDWIGPKLAQAQCQNIIGNYAAALELTSATSIPADQLKGPSRARWLQTRATALWRTDQTNTALTFVNTIATEHRDEIPVLLAVADFLANVGHYSDELEWRTILLQCNPTQNDWVTKKGHAELRAGQLEAALATLTQALVLDRTNPNARLFRAVAALRAGKLAEAQQDYQQLLSSPSATPLALFGLGSVAWQAGNTNAMVQYYQAFLTNTATAAPQAALANQRLKDWQDE